MKGPAVASWTYLPSRGGGVGMAKPPPVSLPLHSVLSTPMEADEPINEEEELDLDKTEVTLEQLPVRFKRLLDHALETQRLRLWTDLSGLLAHQEANFERWLSSHFTAKDPHSKSERPSSFPESPIMSFSIGEMDPGEGGIGSRPLSPWHQGQTPPHRRGPAPAARGPRAVTMQSDALSEHSGPHDSDDQQQMVEMTSRKSGSAVERAKMMLKSGGSRSKTAKQLSKYLQSRQLDQNGATASKLGTASSLSVASWKRTAKEFIGRDEQQGSGKSLPYGSRAKRAIDRLNEIDERRKSEAWERATEDNMVHSENAERQESKRRTCQERMNAMIQDVRFELLVFALIFSNVVVVGIEVDYNVRHGEEYAGTFLWIDAGFTFMFVTELVIRIYAQGWNFLSPSQRLWNSFDVFVVTTALIELLISAFLTSSEVSLEYIRFIRILRVTRFLRAVRLIRLLRFIRALRTLVHSIFSTLKSLIWALLLIVMVFYGFGMAITQAVGRHLRDVGDTEDGALDRYWSSLGVSMFTLYKSISGGLNWHTVVTPLSKVSPWLVAVFICYVTFTFFAVLNVITGTFCQSAIDSAAQDKEMVAIHQMANRERMMNMMKALFRQIDDDGSGAISIEEFERYLANDEVRAYFASLDIDTGDAWMLFKLLDKDEEGSISQDEFLEGCLSIKGDAKAIHVVKLQQDNRFLQSLLQCFMEDIYQQFDIVNKHLKVPGSGWQSMSASDSRTATVTHSARPAQWTGLVV